MSSKHAKERPIPKPGWVLTLLAVMACIWLAPPVRAQGAEEPGASPDSEPAEEGAAEDDGSDFLLVLAGAVHAGDGQVHSPGELLIKDGLIEAVGVSLESPEGARVWDLPDAVITPGLIDPSVSIPLGSKEGKGNLQSLSLSTSDARDPFDPWLASLRSEGIVAACLEPRGQGLFRGRAVSVGTTGPDAAGAPLLADDAHLTISLETTKPGSTARAAARAALEQQLDGTKKYKEAWSKWREQEKGDEGKSPAELAREERKRKKTKGKKRVKKPALSEPKELLLKVLDKEIPLRIEASRKETVQAALDLSRSKNIEIVLTACTECGELAQNVSESRAVVVLDPLGRRVLEGSWGQPDPESIRQLSDAGARLAVSSHGPWPSGPTWLRTAAANLVSLGVSPESAIAAMTGEAAAAAGLAETHGHLAPGRASEFAIWTGDPLDPTTRLDRLVEPDDTAPPEEAEDADDEETEEPAS